MCRFEKPGISRDQKNVVLEFFFVLFTVASMLSVLVIECVAFIIISVGCACFGVFMGVFMHLRHRSRLALTGLRLFCAPC